MALSVPSGSKLHSLKPPIISLNVDLGGSIPAREFENRAYAALKSPMRPGSQIVFDFRGTSFVEPAALQLFVSLTRHLKQVGSIVVIRVPERQKPRDFWRAWGFPAALSLATSTSFFAMVDESSRKYFGEPPKYYTRDEFPCLPNANPNDIRSTNFFGFCSQPLPSANPSSRLAYQERGYWDTVQVRDVIEKKLGKNADYFPSRVVFEAFLNAMRHPGASLVQTASLDQKAAKKFTVHFWDDGRSMTTTMSRALEAGIKVRGEYEVDLDRNYFVIASPHDVETDEGELISSRTEIGRNLPEEKLLLSTIFPCVTSDPLGIGHAVDPKVMKQDPRYGRRGMGLYVLVNGVVDVLGGEVGFRTGRFFMNVSQNDPTRTKCREASYKVRVRIWPKSVPSFLGNQIVVRVPIQ